MINTDELCMNCMKEIGKLKRCPHCGFHADSPQTAPYLPLRSVVGNRYLIGRLVDFNGEGATYHGWDLANRTPVSVREFLPDAIATRDPGSPRLRILAGCDLTFSECCQSFLELWRKLARLRGLSALISVIDIVEDHATAYAVSERFDGMSLREYLLNGKTGFIAWEKARQLLMPVLSTLGTLHSSGIIHRGISPTTLFVGSDGKVRFSGFCIWQARTAKGDLNAQLFPGYAAIEQYERDAQQGPWTDIYAFAAVLYRTLIGTDPIEAPIRAVNDKLMVPAKFAEQLPAYVINALINALQIMPGDRTRSVEQLRAELSASPNAAAAAAEGYAGQGTPPAPAPARAEPPPDPHARKRALSAGFTAAIISLGAGLAIFLIFAFATGIFGGSKTETTTVQVTSESTQFEVPDFKGMSYLDITSNPVWTEKFTFEKVDEYSDTVLMGYIIDQTVPAGTMLEKGSQIALKVSKGKEMIELPDVRGLEFTAAKAQLEALGFKVVKVDRENDGLQVENTVYAASLAFGVQYEKGTSVSLQVWTALVTTTAGETTAP